RQHGVNVSDPDSNGSVRVNVTAKPGSQPSNSPGTGAGGAIASEGGAGSAVPADAPPEMQAAMNACKQYQPQGSRRNGPPDQKTPDAMTKFAQRMRDHGIPMQ